MSRIARHSLFSKLPLSVTKAFGIDVDFDAASGAQTFRAIVREKADEMSSPGAGVLGNEAYLRLATLDAQALLEGDTFDYPSMVPGEFVRFKLEGEPIDSGHGMTSFELSRVEVA
jgi:hypothetical protein